MNRRPILIAGAAVAVVAFIAIAWVALGAMASADPDPSPNPIEESSVSPSLSPTAEPSASETPAPSRTPEPSAEAGPIQVAWTAATGIEPTAIINKVAYLEARWFAVGGVADDFLTAAIWTSQDGANWTPAEIDRTNGPNEATNVIGVVETQGTLVAFGSWGVVPSDQRAWMTWRSTDGGATWTESRGSGPEPGALGALTGASPGLVGAGWTYAGTTPFDTYFVTSSDGIAWQRTAGTLANAQVLDLDVIGDRIVAVGSVFLPTGQSDAAAWYSDDGGASWTQVDVPDGGSSLTMVDLVPFGEGLAAIGDGGRSDFAQFVTTAWTTSDGQTWELFEVADGVTSSALAGVDGGLVGVGNFAAQDIGPGVAFTSTDAESWVEGEQLGNGSVRLSAVAGEDDVVVAGGQCQSSACETVIWVGQLSN